MDKRKMFRDILGLSNKTFTFMDSNRLLKKIKISELQDYERLLDLIRHTKLNITKIEKENFKKINVFKKELFKFLRGDSSTNPTDTSLDEIKEQIKKIKLEYFDFSNEGYSNYTGRYKYGFGREMLKLFIHIYVTKNYKEFILSKASEENLNLANLKKDLMRISDSVRKFEKKVFNAYCSA